MKGENVTVVGVRGNCRGVKIIKNRFAYIFDAKI